MPASYPNAVVSFASRSNGQTIDASHVQGLQDEVTALESGLLTGTAPINASNATLNTLLVNSSVSFPGTVTFSGTVNGIGTNTPPVVKVRNSVATVLGDTNWTGLNWDTEDYDSTGMHSTAVTSSRITFSGSTGIYFVGCNVSFSTISGADKRVRIMENDSSVVTHVSQREQVSAPGVTSPVCLGADMRVSALTDYITVQVQISASTGTIVAHSTGDACVFFAHRVSA